MEKTGVKNRKKIGGFPEALILSEGEMFNGKVLSLSSGKTKFGMADFVKLSETESGNEYGLLISGGLQNIDWEDLKGKEVDIVCKGKKINPKTKREFMSYDVYELE